MKIRFSTLDIIAIVPELKSQLCTGWRVNQVYDCDQKTYLFKLNKSIVQMKKDDDPLSVKEETANKLTFIIESGIRLHTTDYDWPKSPAPGQFSIKLRKHIRNKRIEDIRQIGTDRLVDIQFGTNMVANHLLIELYDRGNLILTDHNYCILAILRWIKPNHTIKTEIVEPSAENRDDYKIGQTYPLSKYHLLEDLDNMSEDKIAELLKNSQIIVSKTISFKKRNKAALQKDNKMLEINLKDLLNPYVTYGSSLLEDKLLKYLENDDVKGQKKCHISITMDEKGLPDPQELRKYARLIKDALDEADSVLREVRERDKSPGYIVQRLQNSDISQKISKSKKTEVAESDAAVTIKTNLDFFPILSCAERKLQLEPGLVIEEFESFDKAVDTYYCNLASQKIDSKIIVAEKVALKKLDNLKIAQEKKLNELAKAQKEDEEKAHLIEINSDKVENALLIVRSMLANQIAWSDIWTTIQEAKALKDPIASLITHVRFDRNEFTMKLNDPYGDNETEEDYDGEQKAGFRSVDIDIGLSAYANARRFFTKRRTAVIKEKKTIEVSRKAFKNVERQTKEMLKEVVVKTNITKARKRYWFENFFWFISTDGYLVVAGRDAEQNEMLVKRYMKNNDIYVHADLHGASSVIIKNESSEPIPPKTLTEAGSMAVCYSSAWDSKIATTSWWVYPKQVSKTAPAGEYLSTGAFIIRGKKNYLPLSSLVLGFGFLFRLDEESIERRRDQRIAKEQSSATEVITTDEEDYSEDNDEIKDDQSVSEDSDRDDRQPISSDKTSEENKTDYKSDVEDSDVDDSGDDLEEEAKVKDYRLVDTLSECPLTDDSLLYSIPMCGPYTAFSNFKYKVKVVPGANKRGKAAKSCLGLFLHDKRATQRERDLLRALRDQDYARNIPNKVKISSANIKTMNKKKPKKSEVRLPIYQ